MVADTTAVGLSTFFNASSSSDEETRTRSFSVYSRILCFLLLADLSLSAVPFLQPEEFSSALLCVYKIFQLEPVDTCCATSSSKTDVVIATLSRCVVIGLVVFLEKIQLERRKRGRGKSKGTVSIAVIFSFSTMQQLYCGYKLSSAEWNGTSYLLKVVYCMSVLWINLESTVARALVAELTRDSAKHAPDIHRHPLYFNPKAKYYMNCDVCRTGIKSGCWQCALCDFDACKSCVKRDDSEVVRENVLRNDSGVVHESSVSALQVFLRALQLTRRHLGLTAIGVLALVLYCVANLLLPVYHGKIIDDLIDSSAGKSHGYGQNIKVYAFVTVIHGLLEAVYGATFSIIGTLLTSYVRSDLFEKILGQDVAFFDGTTTGYLQVRLTHKVNRLMDPIKQSIPVLLRSSLLTIGGTVMCYKTSYQLTTVAFVTLGPAMYLWELYADRSKELNTEMLAAWSQARSNSNEAFSHIQTIKACGSELEEVNSYKRITQDATNAGIKDSIGSAVTKAISSCLDLGTNVLIFLFGGYLVLSKENEITVGDLITFQLYWNTVNAGYTQMQNVVVQFIRASAAAEMVFSILDNEPQMSQSSGKSVDWKVKGNIVIKDLSFYYQMRPKSMVLSNINLTIPSGATCAIVGVSGGGKSTLIKLLLRFYDPRKGSIHLDGHDYRTLNVLKLRKVFGVVPQDVALFGKSIKENIAYGLKPESYTQQDIEAAAVGANAHEFISGMKDKYDTTVGERGSRLSGGQRQRIAIARLLLRRPKVVLLDEATSALDEENQKDVQVALDSLMKVSGATVIVVAHRLSTIQSADPIVVLENGRIVETGNHEELLLQDGPYCKLYGTGGISKAVAC